MATAREREFIYVAKLVVPPEGFRGTLKKISDWHSERGLKQHHGRRERIDGCEIESWCFTDKHTAMAFHKQFGGALQVNLRRPT